MDALLDICEPLFTFTCRLNRTAEMKGAADADGVRGDVKALFESMRARAAAGGLAEQFKRVEQPLVFFIDFMVKESPLPFAGRWKELAFEQGEMAGDEKFFELLDQTLEEKSDAATERLAIYYTCVGLGFTGWYAGQPEYLRKKMREIHERIRPRLGDVDASRICPEAYERVDVRDLIEPAGTQLLGIGIAMLGILLVLVLTNAFLYWRGASELDQALRQIDAATNAPAGAAGHAGDGVKP